MYLEYCNYNRIVDDYTKELTLIFKAMESDIQGFSVPIHFAKEIRQIIPEGYVLSSPIDYPSGYSSTKEKYFSVLHYLKSGVNAIDYVSNQFLLYNRFVDLEKEVQTILSMCADYGATFRAFLDYQYFKDFNRVSSLGKIYNNLGVSIVYPYLGYHHDDFSDALINCKMIEEQTKMSTIFNGYIWKKEQIDIVIKSDVFGMRIYDIPFWCNNTK